MNGSSCDTIQVIQYGQCLGSMKIQYVKTVSSWPQMSDVNSQLFLKKENKLVSVRISSSTTIFYTVRVRHFGSTGGK